MEWGCSHLKSESHKHERHAEVGQYWTAAVRVLPKRLADRVNSGRAGRSEHKRDTVQEKGGGKRSQQEIFDRRFTADSGASPESREDIGGDRRDFERDKDQYQLHRTRHQHHANCAE